VALEQEVIRLATTVARTAGRLDTCQLQEVRQVLRRVLPDSGS
jgi:hypothetical protein